jgi:hypothetical protein
MAAYWCFRLGPVAERILYLEAMKTTERYEDVTRVIERFRDRCETIRPRQTLPV